MKTLILGLATGLLVSVAACTTKVGADDETPASGKPITLVTYNGGLAVGFVPGAKERAADTSAAVVDLDADVICVQEFWNPEHVDELKSKSSTKFPHSVFMPPDPGTTGPAVCTDEMVKPLLDCVVANGCDKVCSDKVVSCVLGKCITEYNELSSKNPDCTGCIQANVGKEVNDIIATCKAESTEYAFGGAFGIGLLSRYEIKAQATKILDSTTNRRGVIYAQLATPRGDVHVMCTHLTAVFAEIPYPKAEGSWEEEQAAQIDVMLSLADQKAGAGGAVALLGDFNTGPAGKGYVAEVQANYDKFIAAGFSDPYVADANNSCTYCADNPLVGNDDSTSGAIDHIFLRGLAGSTVASRVLDETVPVSICGETIDGAYSDHYGVSVTVE